MREIIFHMPCSNGSYTKSGYPNIDPDIYYSPYYGDPPQKYTSFGKPPHKLPDFEISLNPKPYEP